MRAGVWSVENGCFGAVFTSISATLGAPLVGGGRSAAGVAVVIRTVEGSCVLVRAAGSAVSYEPERVYPFISVSTLPRRQKITLSLLHELNLHRCRRRVDPSRLRPRNERTVNHERHPR